MSKDNEYIDAGADHSILEVLPHLNYTTSTALAEFVDNSVQSYIDNKANLVATKKNFSLQIKIKVSKDRRKIIISDNAAGISESDWSRVLKAGAPPFKKKKNSLNEFGMGMKCASYWFSRQWSIETKSLKEKVEKTVNLDLDKIKSSKDGRAKVNRNQNPKIKHGTTITLKNCHQPIGKDETFIERLESIHRNFLNNEIKITYEREGSQKFSNPPYVLSFKLPEFSRERPTKAFTSWLMNYSGNYKSEKAKKSLPEKILWKVPFDITFGVSKENVNKFRAKGYIGKLIKSGSHRGLYYFRRKKLLESGVFPSAIYSSQNSSSYQNKYIYGEVHFSDNVKAVFTKNALSLNELDMFDFEKKLNEVFRDTNRFQGTSFWEQLGVGIDKMKDLEEEYRLISKGKSKEVVDASKTNNYPITMQFNAIQKQKGKKEFSRKPEDPVSTGHKRPPISSFKKDKVRIDGISYRILVNTTWDDDYFDSWLQFHIDKKKKLLTIQIALSHVFFKQYFLDAATNDKGKKIIGDGIIVLSEFIVSSTIYSISNLGVRKAETVLNNLNSILRELPPSDKRKDLS